MRSCSVGKRLRITAGSREDYKRLAHYHYRDTRPGPFAAIFALKPDPVLAARAKLKTVGVIVYTMPSPALELRNIALRRVWCGLDRQTQLALINKSIRCISRVIIEPRFRSLGLATRLVRETMPKMNIPIIEALAVMGLVNPFFEKAGMKAFTAKMPARCLRLTEAFSIVGIEKQQLLDARYVQQKIDELPAQKAKFIEREMGLFLASYGQRRNMSPGLERTRYILSKLTARPVYYIWFNPKIKGVIPTGSPNHKTKE